MAKVFFLLLISHVALAQQPPRQFSIDEMRLKTIFLYQPISKDSAFSGSGFIVKFGTRYLLTTARHVAAGLHNAFIVFPRPGKAHADFLLNDCVYAVGDWKKDDSSDISIIEIKPTRKLTIDILELAAIPFENILGDTHTFDAIVEVGMFGYPIMDNLGKRFSPLVFEGPLASDGLISGSYEAGGKTFYCDYFYLQTPSMQGLSGGPVCAGYSKAGMFQGLFTILVGITSGTAFDNTGGKSAEITPSIYLVKIIEKDFQ